MAGRTALAKKPYAAGPVPIEHEVRSGAYGGLVAQLIGEIDARMTAPPVAAYAAESPDDAFHTVSVACGYIGLAAGFAAAAWGISLLL